MEKGKEEINIQIGTEKDAVVDIKHRAVGQFQLPFFFLEYKLPPFHIWPCIPAIYGYGTSLLQ